MAIEHKDIANADLHEPIDADSAVINTVYASDGAGSGSWGLPPNAGVANHVSVQNADFGKGATAPTSAIVGDYSGWLFTISDDAVFTIELPHDLDPAEDIGVHFTWAINEPYATANGEVNFQADWSLTPYDSTEAIDAPTHSGSVSTGDINIPATAYHMTHNTMAIAAANVAALDTLGVKFSRIALIGGVGPTAEPLLLAVHIEYTTKET